MWRKELRREIITVLVMALFVPVVIASCAASGRHAPVSIKRYEREMDFVGAYEVLRSKGSRDERKEFLRKYSALMEAQKRLRKDPDNPKLLLKAGDAFVKYWSTSSRSYEDRRFFNKALIYYLRALQIRPFDESICHRIGELVVENESYFRLYDFMAQSEIPFGWIRDHIKLCKAKVEAGKLEKELKIRGPNRELLIDLAKSYYVLERYEDSRRYFRLALKMSPFTLSPDPAVVEILLRLAEVNERLAAYREDPYKDAKEYFESYLENLGRMYRENFPDEREIEMFALDVIKRGESPLLERKGNLLNAIVQARQWAVETANKIIGYDHFSSEPRWKDANDLQSMVDEEVDKLRAAALMRKKLQTPAEVRHEIRKSGLAVGEFRGFVLGKSTLNEVLARVSNPEISEVVSETGKKRKILRVIGSDSPFSDMSPNDYMTLEFENNVLVSLRVDGLFHRNIWAFLKELKLEYGNPDKTLELGDRRKQLYDFGKFKASIDIKPLGGGGEIVYSVYVRKVR